MRHAFLLNLAAVFVLLGCSLGGLAARTQDGTVPPDTALPGLTLPPEWTATPTITPRPITATPTGQPASTSRPVASASSRTPAPTLPNATAAPNELDISNWLRIDTGHAYFWLPAAYQVADLGGLGDLMKLFMVALVQGLSQGFQDMVGEGTPGPTPTMVSMEELQAGFDIDFLMAADKNLGAAVFVVGEPAQQSLNLADQLEDALRGIKGTTEVLSRHAIANTEYPTARAIVIVRDIESGDVTQQAVYLIQADDRLYTFSYQTTPTDFENLWPVFERSIATFQPHAASK
jgi:hypothetical protein